MLWVQKLPGLQPRLRLLDLRTGRVVRSVTADAAAYFRVVPLQGDPPPGAIVL